MKVFTRFIYLYFMPLLATFSSFAESRMTLVTTKPGPFTLYTYWEPANETNLTYVWQGKTNTIAPSPTWHVTHLTPSQNGMLQPAIVTLLPREIPSHPIAFLYAQGDPIHLANQNGNWLIADAPMSGTPTASILTLLPDLTGAKIQVHEDGYVVGTYTAEALKKYQPSPTAQRLTFSPIYPTNRAIYPMQTGSYLFKRYDQTFAPIENVALYLQTNYLHHALQTNYLGECIRFFPDDFLYTSTLQEDAIIRFEEFHDLERTHHLPTPYGRWTASTNARIHIVQPIGTSISVTLQFAANRPDAAPLLEMQVGTMNSPLQHVDIQSGFAQVTLELPAQKETEASITVASPTWSPADIGLSGDRRQLGVMLTGLHLQRLPFAAPAPGVAQANQP